MLTPTVASVNAAPAKTREETGRPAGITSDEGGVGEDSANAESRDENSAGISNSEDWELAIFAFCCLRALFARGRSVRVLALLG